ncbi:hypothetical protein HDU98_012037 [Podochytrium sp. JEL0797]|nr:hypothetical protein HDU98_012037 [Podochytrium sp. JEL0797]
MGYLEVALNFLYTGLTAIITNAIGFLVISDVWGKPAGKCLFALFLHDLLYCLCEETLKGFSLLVSLEDYRVPFVLCTKFLECYSKNALTLYALLTSVMYMDSSAVNSFLSIQFIVTNNTYLNTTLVTISFICVLTAITAIASETQVLIRPDYLFVSNPDAKKLEIIIYSFGWTSLFALLVLIIKWTAYFQAARTRLATAKDTSEVTKVLQMCAIMCTIQQIISVFITIVPGAAGIDQSQDPWLTILNVSSVVSMPLDASLPLYLIWIKSKRGTLNYKSMGYLEVVLNLLYTGLTAIITNAIGFLVISDVWGKPAGKCLFALFVHDLLYCLCEETLNGFSLLVSLEDYRVPFVLCTKFLECYSKNALTLYALLTSVMYMDSSAVNSFLSIQFIVTNHTYLNRTLVLISFICVLTAITAIASETQVLIRPDYLFVSNPDANKLQIIIYSFGWTSIFALLVLIIKWTAYFQAARTRLATAKDTSEVTKVLQMCAIMCTIQQIISVFITIVPGAAGIDQSQDPWLTILNVSSVVSMPLDASLPLYLIWIKSKRGSKRETGGQVNSRAGKSGNNARPSTAVAGAVTSPISPVKPSLIVGASKPLLGGLRDSKE